MGIEEQIDRLIDLGEDIKSRLDLLVEMASDHFAGANKMVVDEPAKEPEPAASEKPPEPEYREPVLPADACKECQFSDDGIEWRSGWLNGWVHRSHQWISHSGGHWRHARIKKDG